MPNPNDRCPKCNKPWTPARVEDVCLDLECHWLKGARMHLSPFLAEKGKTHGEFKTTATVSQELKYIFRQVNHHPDVPVFAEALDNIAVKLARILVGNIYEPDHWVDLAGYANLAADFARQVGQPPSLPEPVKPKLSDYIPKEDGKARIATDD